MANTAASAPREAARHARRRALLEAAEQVFAERGFEGTTMAEIASRAGYSAGNLYNVFDSKEALFREVVDDSTRRFQAVLLETFVAPQPLAESLERFFDALVGYVLEHRALFAVYLRLTASQRFGRGAQEDDARALDETGHESFTARIRRAMESGEIPHQDPEACAVVIGGAVRHQIVRWLDAGGSDQDLHERMRSLRSVLCRALGLRP